MHPASCHCEPFSKPSEEKARQSLHSADRITPPRDCFVALPQKDDPTLGTSLNDNFGRLSFPRRFSCHSRANGNPGTIAVIWRMSLLRENPTLTLALSRQGRGDDTKDKSCSVPGGCDFSVIMLGPFETWW